MKSLVSCIAALAVTIASHAGEPDRATTSAPATPRSFVTLTIPNPRGLAVDAAGTLYVGDVESPSLHQITSAGKATPVAGVTIADPIGIAVDRNGTLFVADADNNSVLRISGGASVSIGKPAAGESGLSTPTSVAVDAAGNVFVADNGGAAIRRIAADGSLTTFAGKRDTTGGEDGKGSAARFAKPRGIAIDRDGTLYVADEANHNIRKITADGVVTTLAGAAGQAGAVDATGTNARFNAPRAIAVDAAGNVFVADTDNQTIRKITPDGAVTTIAGKPGEPGTTDGRRDHARFSGPRGIAVDRAGNVFVADSDNGSIRQITPDGNVSTIVAAAR
jgi:sugar lactone lactonase YvrE